MASFTRNKKYIYLIGFSKEHITGCKLPSIREVLRTYFFKIQTDTNKYQHKSCSVALNETIDEVLGFWNKAQIPTKQNKHISSQLQKCSDEWRRIKKNQYRRTDSQIQREEKFMDYL